MQRCCFTSSPIPAFSQHKTSTSSHNHRVTPHQSKCLVLRWRELRLYHLEQTAWAECWLVCWSDVSGVHNWKTWDGTGNCLHAHQRTWLLFSCSYKRTNGQHKRHRSKQLPPRLHGSPAGRGTRRQPPLSERAFWWRHHRPCRGRAWQSVLSSIAAKSCSAQSCCQLPSPTLQRASTASESLKPVGRLTSTLVSPTRPVFWTPMAAVQQSVLEKKKKKNILFHYFHKISLFVSLNTCLLTKGMLFTQLELLTTPVVIAVPLMLWATQLLSACPFWRKPLHSHRIGLLHNFVDRLDIQLCLSVGTSLGHLSIRSQKKIMEQRQINHCCGLQNLE